MAIDPDRTAAAKQQSESVETVAQFLRAKSRDASWIALAAVVALYAVGTGGITIYVGEPTKLWWWLLEVPFFLWIVAPMAAPLLVPFKSWFLTVSVTAMAGYSFYVYLSAMFGPGARSTSALVFIFLPIYQLLGVFVLIALAWGMKRIVR